MQKKRKIFRWNKVHEKKIIYNKGKNETFITENIHNKNSFKCIYLLEESIAGFGKGKGADVKIYQNVRKLCADSVYIRGKKEIRYILQEYSSSSSRKIVA